MDTRAHPDAAMAPYRAPLAIATLVHEMSVFVWSMVGIAIWHFTVFIPDRFAGGIVGAFLAAWIGGVASGFLIEGFALPSDNPPGMRHALYALPGSLLGLVASYAYGGRSRRRITSIG
jgi:hypothetical protein